MFLKSSEPFFPFHGNKKRAKGIMFQKFKNIFSFLGNKERFCKQTSRLRVNGEHLGEGSFRNNS